MPDEAHGIFRHCSFSVFSVYLSPLILFFTKQNLVNYSELDCYSDALALPQHRKIFQILAKSQRIIQNQNFSTGSSLSGLRNIFFLFLLKMIPNFFPFPLSFSLKPKYENIYVTSCNVLNDSAIFFHFAILPPIPYIPYYYQSYQQFFPYFTILVNFHLISPYFSTFALTMLFFQHFIRRVALATARRLSILHNDFFLFLLLPLKLAFPLLFCPHPFQLLLLGLLGS